MSNRLREKVETKMTKDGPKEGMAKIILVTHKSERTIRRWLSDGFPTAHDAYLVALACDCEESEALALAKECFPDGARETA